MPPVLISAGIGGLGPGLLATILSVAAVFLGLGAPSALSEFGVVNGVAFVITSIGVSWGGELLHSSRRRAIFMTRDALAREAHLQSILDTVPEAMIVIDERGLIQSFSQRGRAAVRLPSGRGHRPQRLDPDADALQRKP